MSTGAEISFGTTVQGLPASTDAELYSERQRTACKLILPESMCACGNCQHICTDGRESQRQVRVNSPVRVANPQ